MRRVYAYAAYRVGGGPDAEDVTSEVFERAFRYRSSYRPEQGAPITWLIGIARRVVDDRRLPAVAQQVGDEADGFDMEAVVIDRLTVLDALAMLSDRDRELVAMRYGSDLPSDEIGVVLGCTRNAADVALHRALKRLRRALEVSGWQMTGVGQRG
jgi:RNA polymerase sigma-70 factor (ECF subfamily)